MSDKETSGNRTSSLCKGIRYDDSACGRILYDDHFCIFHSRNIEHKQKSFNKEFDNELIRQKNEEIYDFTGFIFPDSISFKKYNFNKNVYFKRSKFYGNLVDFSEARFLNDFLDFSDSKFFGKTVLFEKTKFNSIKNTDFYGTEFKGEGVSFSNALFTSNRIHFIAVKFFSKKGTSFNRAKFSGLTFFNASGFYEKNVTFIGTEFKGILTAFDEAFFFEKVNLFDSYFENVEGLFEILKGKPKRYLFKRFVPDVFKTKISFSEKMRILTAIIKYKFTFLRKMKYRVEDFRFRLGEKSAIRYPLINRMIKDDWFLYDFKRQNKIIYFLWRIFADCGRSFWLWAVWAFTFAFIFAFIFYWSYLYNPYLFKFNAMDIEPTFLSFLYYSVVTFTTLGFGDIVPTTQVVQILVMLEVILGYFMLGGLISILAVKLARRS